MKNILLLGATGSIGKSVLSVIGQNKEKFNLYGISFNKDITRAQKIIQELNYDDCKAVIILGNNKVFSAGLNLKDLSNAKDPKEVLQINGVRTCQEYLVDEVQKTYRDQGVEVHDKHVEMIVRQMLRRVRIVKSNNSDFLPNELVDSTLFRKTNQELVKDGKVPAEGRPELMLSLIHI